MELREDRYSFVKASRWAFDGMNSETLHLVKTHYVNLQQYAKASYYRELERDVIEKEKETEKNK